MQLLIFSLEGSPNSNESQAEDEEGCHEVGAESPSEVLNHLPSYLKGYSRLCQEYDILELLGKGGFGFVYKVRPYVLRSFLNKMIRSDVLDQTANGFTNRHVATMELM